MKRNNVWKRKTFTFSRNNHFFFRVLFPLKSHHRVWKKKAKWQTRWWVFMVIAFLVVLVWMSFRAQVLVLRMPNSGTTDDFFCVNSQPLVSFPITDLSKQITFTPFVMFCTRAFLSMEMYSGYLRWRFLREACCDLFDVETKLI